MIAISLLALLLNDSHPTLIDSVDPAGLDNPKFPWNIINGAGGHYDGLDPFNHTLPYYADVAFNRYVFCISSLRPALLADGLHSAYGWSRLTIHNRTHLTHEFVASANGSVLDSATLYKEHQANSEQSTCGNQ